MEELGLNPHDLGHCEAYDSYLEDRAVAYVEREMAEEEVAVEAQYIADEVVLDAKKRAAFAPPSEAERIVAEARRAADAYLADRLPTGWGRTILAPCPIVRARRREPRTRRTRRRLRVRSGSRGDPPDGDPDDEPPLVRGRAGRGRLGVGGRRS